MKRVAIIGAGACGMVLAGLLGDDFSVTLFEKNNKLAKKILASGNGKCNFTNIGDYKNKYNNEFAYKIIRHNDYKKVLEYFTSLGLVYRVDEENRVYPLSESSASVVDILKSKLSTTKILLDSRVNKIEDSNNGVKVYYNKEEEIFDYVVCCSGSSASVLGSEYAYSYLKEYGIEMNEMSASLSPIKIGSDLSSISGVRVKCLVKLYKEDEFIYEEKGEVLFKDDSLSGIVIYNISSMINRDKNKEYKIELDLLSDASNLDCHSSLVGILHPKLVEFYKGYNVEDLRHISFKVISLSEAKDGQVISGGVIINQLNDDLSLKKNPNVFLGGEVIDCDGMCGGYNLQFAFSCAFTIYESLKKTMK